MGNYYGEKAIEAKNLGPATEQHWDLIVHLKAQRSELMERISEINRVVDILEKNSSALETVLSTLKLIQL